MTRARKNLSVDNLAPVILAKCGNLAAVARSFKVTRQAVWKFIQENDELQSVVGDAKEVALDLSEDALMKAVKRGEGWAVCFHLKCKGKQRGYVERQEHTGYDGSPLNPLVITMVVTPEQERGLLGDYNLIRTPELTPHDSTET